MNGRFLTPNLWFLLSAALTFLMCGCTATPDDGFRIAEGDIWNTHYRVKYQSEEDYSDDILAVMQRVENSLSPFKDTSLISRINRGETDTIDPIIREAWSTAYNVNHSSSRMLDPTVGSLMKIWNFSDATGNDEQTPSQQLIAETLESVGFADCKLQDNHIIRKSPSTQFDFSAITKGLAVDKIADMLKSRGVRHYLVEIGGELRAGGLNPEMQDWTVSIQLPTDSANAPVGEESVEVLRLSDQAVATSGNYRNYKEIGGKRYGHIVSPLDGYPVQTDVVSATVVASTCAQADAYATALMAMSPEQRGKWAKTVFDDVKVTLIMKNEDGSLKVDHMTGQREIDIFEFLWYKELRRKYESMRPR